MDEKYYSVAAYQSKEESVASKKREKKEFEIVHKNLNVRVMHEITEMFRKCNDEIPNVRIDLAKLKQNNSKQ